jgi:uncharacterized membrane protein YkvA (DUF1232 family)
MDEILPDVSAPAEIEQRRRLIARWRATAQRLKRDVYALYLAGRDPRTPWYARAVIGLVAAYALSPIDLIPDFIPVLGYLDDLVVVPLGILLAIRLIPAEVLADAQSQADRSLAERRHSRLGLLMVVCIWLLAGAAIGLAVLSRLAP